jgi:hypothetical protein
MGSVRARLLVAVAVAALMAVSAAKAHFLQADPIGYKDNLDLYAYVGDDPLNKTDPKGLSCKGAGPNTVCQIDWVADSHGNLRSATAADHKQYSRLETNYTKAVRAIAAHGGSYTVSYKDNGRPVSFTVTAQALVSDLSRRVVTADPGNVYQTHMGPIVTSSAITPGYGHPATTFLGSRTLDGSNHYQRETIGHEGIHASDEEHRAGVPGSMAPAGPGHDSPYNRASDYLQGGIPWN